jgi:hypothetical protein
VGYAKAYHMEMTADGMDLYQAVGKHVCPSCFDDDYGLKEFVAGNAAEARCDFCGETSGVPFAAPLVDVVRFMNSCIAMEYSDPADEMGWCGAEGGWQGAEVFDTPDLLRDELELQLAEELFWTVVGALGTREFCHRNPYALTEGEELKYSWDSFCKVVKHETRFFFMHRAQPDDETLPDQKLEPADLLQEVAAICAKNDLVKVFPRGTKIFRVRPQSRGEKHVTAASLGPPPPESALQSNRMNPPGVSMMYAGDTEATALIETANKPGRYAVGLFEFQREVRLLDLTALPKFPSLFDPENADRRGGLRFMHRFVDDASRPIAHDNLVHVDYVPTQIVAEYLRTVGVAGFAIDGIRYASAQHTGGVCYAIFAAPSDVTDVAAADPTPPGQPWLALVDRHEHVKPRGVSRMSPGRRGTARETGGRAGKGKGK